MKSLRNILPVLCLVNLILMTMMARPWWLGALVGMLIGAAFYLTCLPVADKSASRIGIQADSDVTRIVPAAPAAEPQPHLEPLLEHVLPAWQSNVQLAREQTQSAIDNLIARFSGIHERLRDALNLSQGGKNANVLAVIQNAAKQLGGIASALENVLASRQALITKLDQLAASGEEIRQLAMENEQLAGRTGVTDLLSSEQSWQELADRSAENSRQIALRAKALRHHVQVALHATGELSANAAGMVDNSRAVIDQVVADFRQSALKLSKTVEQLEGDNREVDQEVCDILVNLQFQDRVSQILEHVHRDIGRMKDLSVRQDPQALPSPEQWLADLEKTYTTQEQRLAHHGQKGAGALSSQVDFF